MLLLGTISNTISSRLSWFWVQLWCNTGGHNGHNGRCGQFFTYFVDIMDEITLYGHNGQLEYLTSNQKVLCFNVYDCLPLILRINA